jgi:hypothetical protein
MSGGPLEPRTEAPEGEGGRPAGSWAGYLIFGLFVLFLALFDARAVSEHAWPDVTGASVFLVGVLIVPTGGARWLRRALRDRKR